MTEETQEPEFDGAYPTSPENPEAMPAGHDQLDEGAGSAAHWRFRRIAYTSALIGIILLPFALLVRTGRWSVRTIAAHDRGWEFGPW